MEAPALILWTFVSPLGVVALVGGVGAVRRFVARNYLICVGPGWLAMAAMVYGTLGMGGTSRALVVATAAPLTGLAIWVRERGLDGIEPFEPVAPPPTPPTWERKETPVLYLAADCGRRRRGGGARATPRRGAIAPPSRTRSNA